MSKIFAYIPQSYEAGTAFTVLPGDAAGDLSFTRPAPADRTDPDSVIESMGINVPRVDYAEEGCPLLLLDTSLSETAGGADIVANMDSIVWSVELKEITEGLGSRLVSLYNSAFDGIYLGFAGGGTIRAALYLADSVIGSIDYDNTDTTLLRDIKIVKNSDYAELKVDGVYVGRLDSLANINSSESISYDLLGKGVNEMDGKTRNNTIDDDVASSNSTATSYVELDTQINNFTTR